LGEREKEVVSINEARKQLQRQNSELGNNMKAQELRLLELETIIKTQQEVYKTLQADMESQREDFSHAKEEVNKAREDFLRQKELSEKLRKEIAKQTPTVSQDEIDDLEEELARSKKEISKLKQQLSATGRTQELDQLRQENKRLTALIARNKMGQYAANGNSLEGDQSTYDIPPDSRVMRNGSSKLRVAPIAAQVSIAQDVDDDEDEESESEEGDDDYEYEQRFSGDEVGFV
jgi:chromosome segregation ATPase